MVAVAEDKIPHTSDNAVLEADTGANNSAAAEFRPGVGFYLAFSALMILSLMVALDGSTLSVALPIMTRKLHGTTIQAFWAGTSFLLASAVVQPVIASLSHIFGRRVLLFVALAFFLAGALISALCNNFTVLIAGRTLQGIGGGGILTLLEILITDLVPMRQRGNYMGLFSLMWALGSVSGPVIGGAFAQEATWRWIFYINLPFIGIGTPLVWFFLDLRFKQTSSFKSKLRRVDWVGNALFVASITAFLVPMTWGGVMYPWVSWHTLVPLFLGVAGVVGLGFWERYATSEPAIRYTIFKDTSAKVAFVTAMFHGLIVWCLLYYLPLYFQGAKGYSIIISGVAIFPGTFTVAPFAAIAGVAVVKTGHYRWFIIVGWALVALGSGLMQFMNANASAAVWVIIPFVTGVGMGILFPTITMAVQAAVEEKDMAFAVAMFTFVRTMGEALGVAIGGVVFQNQVKKKLLKIPQFRANAGELSRDATALVDNVRSLKNKAEKKLLEHVFAESLKAVWILLCVCAGVCLVLSFWIQSYDLNRALETEQSLAEKKSRGRNE